MGNEDYQKEYQKDMQHLSEAFREDEPMTFKGVISDLWEEAKNIGKVWVVGGLVGAGLLAGLTAYRINQNKDYINNLFIPAFKEKLIAQYDYNNNPSEKTREEYYKKSNNLEKIADNRVISKRKDPTSQVEFYGDFFYLSNCKMEDIENMDKNPCFLILGNILEKSTLKTIENRSERVLGKGYLLKNVESRGIEIRDSRHVKLNQDYFIVVAPDTLSKKDYFNYLDKESIKMANSIYKNR